MIAPTVGLEALAAQVVSLLESRGARWRRGELWDLCPLHDDHDPSWSFRPANATWYCQGCGAGGGVVELAGMLGLSGRLDPTAAAESRERMEANRRRTEELEAEKRQALAVWWAAHHEQVALGMESAALAGLLAEGIRDVAVRHFGLGSAKRRVYDDELRGYREIPALVIPWTVAGAIRAIQYRLEIPVGGRYRWHPGSRPTLFNADAVMTPVDDTLVVVEGAKKCAALWGHGMASVAALANKSAWPGLPAASRDAVAAFKGRVVFALDPDARVEAAAAAAAIPNGWVAHLPRKPDDLLIETGGDVDALSRYLSKARRP